SALLSPAQALLIGMSGNAMSNDIAAHEASASVRTTTVRDLGMFARGSQSIRLLTMHGSKGREFDAVALVDVFDGHVPFFTCRPGDELEAEGRRLLYVEMTRAKRVIRVFTLRVPTDKKRASR